MVGDAPDAARASLENPLRFGGIHPFRRRWRHDKSLQLGPLVGGREVGLRMVDGAVSGSLARDHLPDRGSGVRLRRDAARLQIHDRLEIIGEAVGGERLGDPRGRWGDLELGSRAENGPEILHRQENPPHKAHGHNDPAHHQTRRHGFPPINAWRWIVIGVQGRSRRAASSFSATPSVPAQCRI